MDPITNEEDVKYHLGRFYFQRKEYRKALKACQEGLAINPQCFNLLYEAGLAHLSLKDYKSTLKYWKKLLKIAPHSIAATEARWRLERDAKRKGKRRKSEAFKSNARGFNLP